MATAPVKSQPLHNFSLPFLKWGQKNQMNSHHRCRRTSESSNNSSPPPPAIAAYHRSSSSEPDSESEPENRKLLAGSCTAKNRLSFATCSSKKQPAVVLERESKEGDVATEKLCDEGEGEESVAKPWNLRPRRSVAKLAIEIGGASKNGELRGTTPAVSPIPAVQRTENQPKSLRLRGFAEGQGWERKEKRKFWISLSREEIEEDVYALTGSKPARRPKKRPKAVQKQLDNVFPGLYLVGITADSYRVHEALK